MNANPSGPVLAVLAPVSEVDAWVRHEAGRRGDPVATLVLTAGDSYETILDRVDALHARLVVLGPGNERLDLTSRSGRLIRHALVPVLVARPSPESGPIVVGADFSEAALPALAAARAEAEARPSPIIVAHVVGAGAVPFVEADPTGAAMAAMDFTAVLDAAKHELERLVATHVPGAEARVVTGGSAVSLIDLAKHVGARLIVVGSHGRTGLGRLIIGSTAEAVARGASCSVLVVPTTDAA